MIILGPFDLLFSRFAVIVGLVYVHLQFMILPLYTNLEKHDPVLLDAAQDLGANGWHRFWRVTFPLSLPGIFSGSALVFIPVLGMFAIPEILGGKDDWLVGNLIKESFLGTRDWPFVGLGGGDDHSPRPKEINTVGFVVRSPQERALRETPDASQ
jgi:spermidine/putrescine transport system permease protein